MQRMICMPLEEYNQMIQEIQELRRLRDIRAVCWPPKDQEAEADDEA